MISLFLTFALAACPSMFGKKNADGTWNFAEGVQQPGMVEVEVDENCKAQADDLELLKGKYKVNASKKAARLAEESDAKAKEEARKARKKVLQDKVQGSQELTYEEAMEAIKILMREK